MTQPVTPPPSLTPGRPSQQDDEHFRFCIRNANPELWRQTMPLIVRVRCKRHKGLIATWMAIHWLIVLYASAPRRGFGIREIAAEANVSRNELTGPDGYIQRLVDLGLIRIVGKDDRGEGRWARPIYGIDLWDLERQSMEIAPEILRAEGLPPPPRPHIDPRQMSFLAEIGPSPVAATAAPDATQAPAPTAVHSSMQSWPSSVHEELRVMHENGTSMHRTGPGMPVIQPAMHETGTAMPVTAPGDARNRDVRAEEKEGEERRRETAPPADFSSFASTLIDQTIRALAASGTLAATPAQPAAPQRPLIAPPGQPTISSSLHDLWGADRDQVRQRDLHQLDLLAGTYDALTNGHGAYWVARAILMAETCLDSRTQRPSVPYLKALLRRWQAEGSWGSDLEGEETVEGLPARSLAPPRLVTPPAAPPAGDDHPAVRAYVEAFREAPNTVQAEQIAATVTDLAAWGQVLTDWQLNGWGERSVGKMLDRYQKGLTASDAPVAEAPLSALTIYNHPGLSDQQRDRWIRKFRAATTPAEQRAILAQLDKEHPR